MDIFKLPNLLTISRIFLMIPIIQMYIAYKETDDTSFLIYCLCFMFVGALTDFFDGYLARKRNESTKLGKILDPLADKIGIGAMIITFYMFDQIPFWIVAIIIGRDLLIVLGALLLMGKIKDVPSSELAGKVTAFMLALLMFVYMLEWKSIEPIIVIATILSISYSLLDYILKFIKLNQRK